MALVIDWLGRFITAHEARYPIGWPEAGTIEAERLYASWKQAMLILDPKPTEAEAEAASQALRSAKALTCEDYPAAVARQILTARSTASGPRLPPPDSRSALERLCRDCPHCHGSGLVTLYRSEYRGDPVLPGGLARTMAHCVCDLGRWMRAKTKADDLPRIPDLATIMADKYHAWSTVNPVDPAL